MKSNTLSLELTVEELVLLLDQIYLHAVLDFKQRTLLPEDAKEADKQSYIERQKTRVSILKRIFNKLSEVDSATEVVKQAAAEAQVYLNEIACELDEEGKR